MLTAQEIETLKRWARSPETFCGSLVSHRELLQRAADTLEKLQNIKPQTVNKDLARGLYGVSFPGDSVSNFGRETKE